MQTQISMITAWTLRTLVHYPKMEKVPKIVETFKTEQTLAEDLAYLRIKPKFQRM